MAAPLAGLLLEQLGAGAKSAAELGSVLGVSQATISRLLAPLLQKQTVLRIGTTRGARYALRRQVAGIGSHWPVYLVNTTGGVEQQATLYSLTAEQYYLESKGALGKVAGLSTGLPYFLQDQRPAGFLGSRVPTLYPELGLPQRVVDWTDDHYLTYLTQRGSDTLGNVIVGTLALDGFLASLRASSAIEATECHKRFPQLAKQSMESGLPGSSAHGEHPKFAVQIQENQEVESVLVKFSPPFETEIGQRWSDLLMAEHQAHVILNEAGYRACSSQVPKIEDRTYLQMSRFDRTGAHGRIGVTSLLAIDKCFYGRLDRWTASGERLLADNRIESEDLQRIRFLACFGSLIANTDQHFGNLSFFDDYSGRFKLAPVYDMLPMLFAPEHEQIVQRIFVPPDPTSETLTVYARARGLAEEYWQRLASDKRITENFRRICAACLQTLNALPRTGSFSYDPSDRPLSP
jgi:hypothetical protein